MTVKTFPTNSVFSEKQLKTTRLIKPAVEKVLCVTIQRKTQNSQQKFILTNFNWFYKYTTLQIMGYKYTNVKIPNSALIFCRVF